MANAISFLQVQDGILDSVWANRKPYVGAERTSTDKFKSNSDKATYDAEFSDLQGQLYQLSQSKFNGVNLFDEDGSETFGTVTETLDVNISGDGGSSVAISKSALAIRFRFSQTETVWPRPVLVLGVQLPTIRLETQLSIQAPTLLQLIQEIS